MEGKKLKMYRKALGITQRELAVEFGITREHLAEMERGAEVVRPVYLLAAERLLHRAKRWPLPAAPKNKDC